MKWTIRFATVLLLIFCSISTAEPARADEKQEAVAATDEILTLFTSKQYELVWNQKTSQWFKAQATKPAFLANMTMGRSPLGNLVSSSFVTSEFTDKDPSSGVVARIYANTYLNEYQAGKFYERIVVMKESDGKFRLYGIWGSPAQ